jgi:ABC-type dipeptide/oligopeptide/nickel transport system permease subunit
VSVTVSPATRAPVIGAPRVRASQAFRRLWANPSGRIGLLMLSAMVIAAAAAPLLAPYSPNTQDYTHIMQAPNSHFLLGTDDLGRDILSRVLYGGRISLRVGALPVFVGFVIGTCVGLIAGFYRGIVDDLFMRLTDIALAFPGVLLALVVIAILGPGLTNVMIALGIADIPIAVRVSRGVVLSLREEPYVQSAIASGASDLRIMRRHLMPSVVPAVLVVFTLEVANALLIASGLSYLGLGASLTSPEWGAMLADGQQHIQNAWWSAVFPGVAIILAVMAVNLLGDGLRDALDPKTTRV